MISLFVTLIVFLILGMIVFQTFYVLGYQKFLSADSAPDQNQSGDTDQPEDSATYSPPAAVILCLKGSDDGLADCLTGIIGQDYPDFQLNIVIHSKTDPAAKAVEEFFSNLKFKPKIHYLESPLETCSLKCSAISQAVRALSKRVEVVAFIDDDAVVDQDWLSDLVTPLGDTAIGATTGNRWYSPADATLGSFVRKIWNAAAIVQMQRYDIAWGGSLAIRREVIDRCQVLSTWERSFCEDTSLARVLREKQLRLHRVPNLVIENKDLISFWRNFHWVSRQLLTVRLHHPAWPLVLLHGITTGIASIVAPLLLVLLLVIGRTDNAWALLQAIVVYQVANFVLLYLIGRSNRQAINERGSYNRSENSSEMNVGMHFFATLVTQIVQPFAVWNANSIEKVNWRGAVYKVKDGRKVKLLKVDGRKIPSRRPVVKKEVGTDSVTASVVSRDDNSLTSGRFSKRSRN